MGWQPPIGRVGSTLVERNAITPRPGDFPWTGESGCGRQWEFFSRPGAACDTMAAQRAGRADRAPGRCRAGEGLLGGAASPAAFPTGEPSRLAAVLLGWADSCFRHIL